jgi:hypothetical protein
MAIVCVGAREVAIEEACSAQGLELELELELQLVELQLVASQLDKREDIKARLSTRLAQSPTLT